MCECELRGCAEWSVACPFCALLRRAPAVQIGICRLRGSIVRELGGGRVVMSPDLGMTIREDSQS